MKHCAKRIFRQLCLLTLCVSPLSFAQSFTLKTVALDHPVNGNLLRVGDTLAVSGHSSDSRWLSVIDLNTFSARPITLPPDAQFFAKMTLANHAAEQLVFLTTQGISRIDSASGESRPLVTTPSLYPVVDRKRFRHLDIAHDLTGSGLSDLLIPDFTAYHVLIQKNDGSFSRYRLPIDTLVQTWGTEPHFMPRTPYIVDMNLDGKSDIVFLRDGQFLVFYQRADGSFSEEPKIFTPGMKISSDNEAIVRSGEGRDFGGLVIHRVHDIEDLDGDGLADLIIRREEFSSAVEQDYNYRIHYGRKGEQGLHFPVEPDAHINTRGIQFESVFADITGNGRKDFYTPSATFGVGAIIRALVSGTANLDMQFYLMNEDRSFNSRPDHNHRAVANVSIGRGAVDLPIFQVADMTGSGRKDLILGENQERLRIYSADERRLFAQQGARFNTPLPRDGSRVQVMDINNDGKDDLILPFDNQDSPETRNQVRFLIVQ